MDIALEGIEQVGKRPGDVESLDLEKEEDRMLEQLQQIDCRLQVVL